MAGNALPKPSLICELGKQRQGEARGRPFVAMPCRMQGMNARPRSEAADRGQRTPEIMIEIGRRRGDSLAYRGTGPGFDQTQREVLRT